MWKPIDAQFEVPRLPVAIAGLGGGGEHFLRSMLECLHSVVMLHWIGNPTDFLKVIAQGERAPRYLIIEGHGTREGIHFGDYGDGVDTSMLVNGCLPPEMIRQHVDLPGCTVISNCCLGGAPAMAEAFLAGKVGAYLGCRTYPDADAASLFLFHFFFLLKTKKLSNRDAWHRAVAAVQHEDIDQFSFFHGDGREERFQAVLK